MSNETSQQPFTENKPRNTDDKELVGQVLGEQAAAEMEELTGKNYANTNGSASVPELGMTAEESDTTKKAEQTKFPEQRKEEYINWAEDQGISTRWVLKAFRFNDDGTVECKVGFTYVNNKVDFFPDSLVAVHGNLNLDGCSWNETSYNKLKHIKITNELVIRVHDVEKIPSGIECESLTIISTHKPTEDTENVYEKSLRKRLKNMGYLNVNMRYLLV